MDIEKLKLEAQNKALHIADVSGSALFNADCMDILPLIPDKSVQLILADLPYGTTACKWDIVLPLKKLWKEYGRIIKDNGAIVLTASQPFTSALVNSKTEWFKYALVWEKERPSNPAHAKIRFMKWHEDILIFAPNKEKFNPQKEKRLEQNKRKNIKAISIEQSTATNISYMQCLTLCFVFKFFYIHKFILRIKFCASLSALHIAVYRYQQP